LVQPLPEKRNLNFTKVSQTVPSNDRLARGAVSIWARPQDDSEYFGLSFRRAILALTQTPKVKMDLTKSRQNGSEVKKL
jgi:hypothetical protein